MVLPFPRPDARGRDAAVLAARPDPAPEPVDERYVPDPLPPLSRPDAPALVGWVAVLFSAVVVLAAGFGLALPGWLG